MSTSPDEIVSNYTIVDSEAPESSIDNDVIPIDTLANDSEGCITISLPTSEIPELPLGTEEANFQTLPPGTIFLKDDG